MTSDGFHSFTYDAEGNIVTVDGAAQYVYDAFNMRVKATSANGTVLHYAYNSGGQRISTWDVSGNIELVTVNGDSDDDPPVPSSNYGAVEIPYEQTRSLPLQAPNNGLT